WTRHAKAAAICRRRGREMGLRLFPKDETVSSPTVTAFYVPEGWSWEALDAALRGRGLVVGGNYGPLAGRVFRVGHMGSQANEELVARGMDILRDVLRG
ncbi:MAG: alanine--glyoxylate aminotransferase family protein, partial [Fretibacterium sp.]|nr:alanine--glyoxylate aminotransferase family protein [Fretibacterium sp.]